MTAVRGTATGAAAGGGAEAPGLPSRESDTAHRAKPVRGFLPVCTAVLRAEDCPFLRAQDHFRAGGGEAARVDIAVEPLGQTVAAAFEPFTRNEAPAVECR